jgi:outer membrane protein OmpA-like peptidoglycan-associated protein
MKRIPILILLLTPFWLWAQSKAYNVHFPSGLHKVESNEMAALEAFLQSNALPYPCLKLELSGHADADGDARANIALSERRVSAVKNALVGFGCSR